MKLQILFPVVSRQPAAETDRAQRGKLADLTGGTIWLKPHLAAISPTFSSGGADLSVVELGSGRLSRADLSTAGTATLLVAVPIGVVDTIEVVGDLSATADALAPSNITVDFFDTFAVTKIQLFDSSNHLLQDDFTLTDAFGNVLGAPPNPPPPPQPPPAAVPEPSSTLLLTVSLGLLFCAIRCRR